MSLETPSLSSGKPKTRTRHNTNCSVYGCHSRKGADRNVHFHYFPKKNCGVMVKIVNILGQEEKLDKRKAWERVLLMGKPVTENMRVCSKHFTKDQYCSKDVNLKQPKLKKCAVPSLNLPKRKVYLEESAGSSQDRGQRSVKRQKINDARNESVSDSQNISDVPLCDHEVSNIEMLPLPYEKLMVEEKVAVQSLLALGEEPKQKFVDKNVQISSGDLHITFTSTIKEDKHLNSLTGIPSFKLLNALTLLVQQKYPDTKQRKLSVKDRIIFVFMKLKMALKFNVLSFLFQISPSSCKVVFVDYVDNLSNILKSSIYWPTYEECQKNIPICFHDFRSVRIVLDCLEIPIERPKCLCCRVRTYSHYKGRPTIKIMTGVSSAGLITFLSKSYGGRTSGKAIFEQSHLINKLQMRQDSIMVDKGFLIDKICQDHFIKLIRPHFLRQKKQFSESESKENLLISRARVHIERVNQRIRIFNILNNPSSNTLIPSIDKIMIIICGMVNLQTPILSADKF